MHLNCSKLFAVGFFSLAVSSGFADIVPIASSQKVSISGSAFICDVIPEPCAADSPFDSFDSALGESGPATVSFPPFGSLFVSASTSGALGISANNISGDPQSFTDISGPANHAQGAVTAINDNSLEFNLTNPYVVHLTGLDIILRSEEGGLFSRFSSNIQFSLTGPKFHFEESCGDRAGDQFCPQTFDTLFTLDPGIYTLNAMTDSSHTVAGALLDSVSEDAKLSLNADFTAVPEPYGTSLVPVLLVAIFAYVARRNSSRIAIRQ